MNKETELVYMTDEDWAFAEPYFKPGEKWGDWRKVRRKLIFTLLAFRKFVDRPVHIHCAYELTGHSGKYHPLGMAVDFHVEGMSVVDQFIALSRFDGFNGIGIYPHWNNPGLHGDIRPKTDNFDPDARWIRDKKGNYLALTWQNLLKEVKHG